MHPPQPTWVEITTFSLQTSCLRYWDQSLHPPPPANLGRNYYLPPSTLPACDASMRRYTPSLADLGRYNYLLPPHLLPAMPRWGDPAPHQPTWAEITTCPPQHFHSSFSLVPVPSLPTLSVQVIQRTRAEAIWFIARRSSKMSTQTLKIGGQGLLYYMVYTIL